MLDLNSPAVREELAWAAGFFDGEGCSTAHGPIKANPCIIVPQAGEYGQYILERFQRAVGNLGRISGPRLKEGMQPIWHFRVSNFEEYQAVIALLWKWLSPAKKKQAIHVLTESKRGWQTLSLSRRQKYTTRVSRRKR